MLPLKIWNDTYTLPKWFSEYTPLLKVGGVSKCDQKGQQDVFLAFLLLKHSKTCPTNLGVPPIETSQCKPYSKKYWMGLKLKLSCNKAMMFAIFEVQNAVLNRKNWFFQHGKYPYIRDTHFPLNHGASQPSKSPAWTFLLPLGGVGVVWATGSWAFHLGDVWVIQQCESLKSGIVLIKWLECLMEPSNILKY